MCDGVKYGNDVDIESEIVIVIIIVVTIFFRNKNVSHEDGVNSDDRSI